MFLKITICFLLSRPFGYLNGCLGKLSKEIYKHGNKLKAPFLRHEAKCGLIPWISKVI